MDARLTVVDPQGGRSEISLPRTRFLMGGRQGDEFTLRTGIADSILAFQFEASLSTWTALLLHAQGHVLLNEQVMMDRAPLESGDHFTILGYQISFVLAPAAPALKGRPVSQIPLPRTGVLVLGRGNPEGAQGTTHVVLDSDDQTISSEHVRIVRQGAGYLIEDVSRFGTTLNGGSFSQAALVYGDRLRLGHYTFEFDGISLQWLNNPDAGMIEAQRLSRTAGNRKILNEVTVRIRPGEFVGILGGSGQGKSTLLNALCGIVPASSGEVRVSRQLLSDRSSIRDLGIGYVPQDDIVHRELIIDDALFLSGKLRLNLPSSQIRARIDRIVEQLGLQEHRRKKVYMLSGGQRKRVSIGIELLSNPSVLYLDEPSSGLDPATEENLMVLLQKLALSGITVVCTTHVLQKAYLFDRLLFIQDGRLVFSGSSDEARLHFLGGAGDTIDELEAPLEKIYSILADRTTPAEVREKAYLNSRYAPLPITIPPAATAAMKVKSRRDRRVPALRALCTLLKRQWKIVISDPLNLSFLLAQAVVIAVLIAWASDDIGMRMFLMVVAAMWFGCSNAAQQIVGEIMIFRRERVSGLGLSTYYSSKLLFLGSLTALQTLLLFSCCHGLARKWHPEEFDRPEFARKLTERYTTVAGLEKPAETGGDMDFSVAGDDEDGVAAPQKTTEQNASVDSRQKAPSPPSPQAIDRLAWLADSFYLGPNLTESGPRDLLLASGERARDHSGKLLFYGGLPVQQVVIVSLGLRFGGLLAAGFVGVILGLTISSLVRSSTQAVMWVPLFLIPQILFGGFVIPFPDMSQSAQIFSQAVPSFACQRLIDVSHIYGRGMPLMSNRTRTPVFLTSTGEKETVTWTQSGASLSQDYDKISGFNRSWQNLLVLPDERGRHKQEIEKIANTFKTVPRDSVKFRQDVKYAKGTVFGNLDPAWQALTCLGCWVGMASVVTLAGLVGKQTGG